MPANAENSSITPALPPAFALFQDFRAKDIGWHQVGRELDAPVVEAQHPAQRLDQAGLGEAGQANQQAMAASQHRDQRFLDDPGLAKDDRADGIAHAGDLCANGFDLLDEAVVRFA